MAEKDEKSLIGFNPLAWMDDESTDSTSTSDAQNIANTNRKAIVSENEANIVEPTLEMEDGQVNNNNDSVSQQNQDDSKIVLDARHNIQNVGDLYNHFKELLDKNNKIEIDASAVTVIDTSTLQLLIVLKQTAIKLHKEVIIDFPSDQFIEAAELLGLSEMLDVDQAAAGLF